MSFQPEEYREPPEPPQPTADDEDTTRLATLIAQTLSGGVITGTDGLPAEVIFTAKLIKGQGWTRCHCKDGCCK